MLIQNALKIWMRNFLVFKRQWLASLLWVIGEPVMYLGAIGFGLGAFVNTIGGKSYVEFYYPGLLCHTAILVSFFEATYGAYNKLVEQKLFQNLKLAPLRTRDILAGEILWCTSKGFIAVLGVMMIGAFFGLSTVTSLLALPIFIFLSFVFTCLGMIFTALAKNYNSFIYSTSSLIVPLSLIAGIYFPMEQLPLLLRWLSYLSPLTQGLELVRAISDLNFHTPHLFFAWGLLLYLIILPRLVIILFKKKLERN